MTTKILQRPLQKFPFNVMETSHRCCLCRYILFCFVRFFALFVCNCATCAQNSFYFSRSTNIIEPYQSSHRFLNSPLLLYLFFFRRLHAIIVSLILLLQKNVISFLFACKVVYDSFIYSLHNFGGMEFGCQKMEKMLYLITNPILSFFDSIREWVELQKSVGWKISLRIINISLTFGMNKNQATETFLNKNHSWNIE